MQCPTAHLWPTQKAKAVKSKAFVSEDKLQDVLAPESKAHFSIDQTSVEGLKKELMAEKEGRDVLRHDGMYEQEVKKRAELLSDNALKMHEKALLVKKQAFGKDSPEAAETLNSMAIVYKNNGQHEEALEHYTECLRVRTVCLGALHPDTAVTVHNIGLLHYDREHWEDAAASFSRAYKLRKKLYGEDHSLTQKSYRCWQEALQRTSGWKPCATGKRTTVPLRTPRAGGGGPPASERGKEATAAAGRPVARRGSVASAGLDEGGGGGKKGVPGRRLSLPSGVGRY